MRFKVEFMEVRSNINAFLSVSKREIDRSNEYTINKTADLTDGKAPQSELQEYTDEQEDKKTKKTCRYKAFAVIHGISRLAVLLTVCTFFLTSFIAALNIAMKITYELPARHEKNTGMENLASVCLMVLLGCTVLLASVVLSLFWEVVILVFHKQSKPWKLTVIGLFVFIVLVVSIVNLTVTSHRPYGVRFLEDSFETSWWVSLVFTSACSVGLMLFVFKEKRFDKMTTYQKVFLLGSLSILVIFLILTPISFHLTGSPDNTVAFSFFYIIFTIIATIGLAFRGKKVKGRKQVSLVNYKIMFSLGFFYFLILLIAGASGITSDVRDTKIVKESWPDGKRREGQQIFPPNLTDKHVNRYLICQNRWGQFDIIELAYLARLPYRIVKNTTVIETLANLYFTERGMKWKLVHMSSKKPVFYHLHETTTDAHVLGIRGTKTTGDWFENAQLWGEIFILQAVSSILPLQRLPKRVISSFIYRSGLIGDLLTSDRARHYFQSIENYLFGILRHNSSIMDITLVGHSLGGGVAKFIGAQMKIPAVAFSSPGEVYNHVKIGYTYEDLQQYTTTVIPDGDFVTWIDKHGGFIQNIRCNAKGIMGCHKMLNTYCELKRGCGRQSRMKCPKAGVAGRVRP